MIYKCRAGEIEFTNSFFNIPFFGYVFSKIKLECIIHENCWDGDYYDGNIKSRLLKLNFKNDKSAEILFSPNRNVPGIFNLFIVYNNNLEKSYYICNIEADKKFTVSIKKNKSGLFASLLKPNRVFSRKISNMNGGSFYKINGPEYNENYVLDNNSRITINRK